VTELLPAVARGVDAVRTHVAGQPVEVVPDGAGGAYVTVHDVEVGARYAPPRGGRADAELVCDEHRTKRRR
jgi:hypothetical protein